MTLKGEHERVESFTRSSQSGTTLKGEHERAESFTQSSQTGMTLDASSELLQCTKGSKKSRGVLGTINFRVTAALS